MNWVLEKSSWDALNIKCVLGSVQIRSIVCINNIHVNIDVLQKLIQFLMRVMV